MFLPLSQLAAMGYSGADMPSNTMLVCREGQVWWVERAGTSPRPCRNSWRAMASRAGCSSSRSPLVLEIWRMGVGVCVCDLYIVSS